MIVLTVLAKLITPSYQKIPVDDIPNDITKIPMMKDYVPSSWCKDCPPDFRILDCWQCWAAHGKVCMDINHGSKFHFIQSSNVGKIFCCKPDYNEGFCQDGSEQGIADDGHTITMICSPPSFLDDPLTQGGAFKDVYTGQRNHQMFSYCPTISQKRCGVVGGSDSGGDMELLARPEIGTVKASGLNYLRQGFHPELNNRIISSQEAEYDACYYEVKMDQTILEDWIPTKLNLKITEKTSNIKVFMYGGTTRKTATKKIVPDNQELLLGQEYSGSIDDGFMVVAYPTEFDVSDFQFEYWVTATEKPKPPPPPPGLSEEEKRQHEEDERRKIEEEAQRQIEEAKRKAEEEARKKAEELARQEEENRIKREKEEAKRKIEEAKRKKEEAKRKAEEEARKKAEEEARKKAEEERNKNQGIIQCLKDNKMEVFQDEQCKIPASRQNQSMIPQSEDWTNGCYQPGVKSFKAEVDMDSTLLKAIISYIKIVDKKDFDWTLAKEDLEIKGIKLDTLDVDTSNANATLNQINYILEWGTFEEQSELLGKNEQERNELQTSMSLTCYESKVKLQYYIYGHQYCMFDFEDESASYEFEWGKCLTTKDKRLNLYYRFTKGVADPPIYSAYASALMFTMTASALAISSILF